MTSGVEAILEANAYTGSALGIVLNLYVLLLLANIHDDNWRSLRVLLMVNSGLDVAYSFVTMLTQMVFLMDSHMVAVVVTGPVRNIPFLADFLAVLYGNLTNTAFVFVPTTFLHRYILIVRSKELRDRHLAILLISIALFQLPYTIASCFITTKKECVEEVRGMLTHFLYTDQAGLAIVYVGGRLMAPEFLAILCVVTVQVIFSYVCTLFCFVAMVLYLRRHQHHMRAETRRLQASLTKTLIAQAAVPALLCTLPIVLILISSFSRFNPERLTLEFVEEPMVTHTVSLAVDIFLFVVCIAQILANFIVLYVWALSGKLRRNDNLILLVSLAFIDFLYAVLQFPYLIILMAGWVPEGQTFNYNPYVIVWVGGPSAALMKSGCTVTTAVAIDRLLALHAPVIYYQMKKRYWSIGAFVVAILLATIDWSVLIAIVPIKPHPECSIFGCFTTETFRQYWGISNMIMNSLTTLLTVVIVWHLCRRRHHISPSVAKLEKENRAKIDKSVSGTKWKEFLKANRVAIYILVVSAAIGVVPGCLNGFGMFVQLEILNEISYFVGTCATLSGLSHAFIFAMAHRDIRYAIGRRMMNFFFGSMQERMRAEASSMAITTATTSQIGSYRPRSAYGTVSSTSIIE